MTKPSIRTHIPRTVQIGPWLYRYVPGQGYGGCEVFSDGKWVAGGWMVPDPIQLPPALYPFTDEQCARLMGLVAQPWGEPRTGPEYLNDAD